MASIFRSHGGEKERRGTADSKTKHNVKSARSFWESQVRSSRVVQVRRGSAENSVSGATDGNDSDGCGMSTMEVLPDAESQRRTRDVSDAEAAIHKLVRDLRGELEDMHHEDLEISLRLASLQGEITSLEDEVAEQGYAMPVFSPANGDMPESPVFSEISSRPPSSSEKKSSSVKHNASHSFSSQPPSDESADEARRARVDSVREKHVASAVKFKRVNSYHGLQSARVVLRPVAPAESVDRLEWNKPHLWQGIRRQPAEARSVSQSSGAFCSGSAEASFDSTFESDVTDYRSTSAGSSVSGAAPTAVKRFSDDIARLTRAHGESESAGSHASSCSSVSSIGASPGGESVDNGVVISTGSPSSQALRSPNSDYSVLPARQVVSRPTAPTALPSLDDDIRTRAVSGIHSDEIVAMYLERENHLRSQLGLTRQGSKQSSLARVRKQGSVEQKSVEQNSAPPVPARSGSFRRSTARVDNSVASSSSFRSSLRRRNSAHLSSSSSSSQLQQSGDAAPALRPKAQSTVINTYC